MPSKENKTFGLAALGRVGSVSIEVDENLNDRNELQMSVTTREWVLRFTLGSRDNVSQMVTFFSDAPEPRPCSELTVGSLLGAPMLLMRDQEYSDRFCLRSASDGNLVDIEFLNKNLRDFIAALVEVEQQLRT